MISHVLSLKHLVIIKMNNFASGKDKLFLWMLGLKLRFKKYRNFPIKFLAFFHHLKTPKKGNKPNLKLC